MSWWLVAADTDRKHLPTDAHSCGYPYPNGGCENPDSPFRRNQVEAVVWSDWNRSSHEDNT
ncbi:uncharacterized protein HHUB_1224 [Halobacterium hubeiense]|uniref:Uncharacterized protein n=1 Tax=Halobacterium hubeiense TaxID=1407499 RepID=A0A0U5GZV4_9EURY|nr:uncharacterized protein HHUB_1224 [Halobacterium hubeiense]